MSNWSIADQPPFVIALENLTYDDLVNETYAEFFNDTYETTNAWTSEAELEHT